ncbi:hypothetical protein M8494_19065 [Serratia ureilytica]
MAARGERRETVLIFGEKRRDEDFHMARSWSR